MKPLGLIVAGGKSERFGSPKILHEMDGIPQWERLHQEMKNVCSSILLNIPSQHRALFPDQLPFEFLLEDTPNGPLEGLCKAFDTYPNRDWLVVACDHFWVDERAFQLLNEHPLAAFLDSSQEIVPWLCKISKEKVFIIQEEKQKGVFSLKRILESLPVILLTPESEKWIIDLDFHPKS